MGRKARGNVAMLVAMALFVVNDSLVKLASMTFPLGQVMALRGIFATAVALGLVFVLGQAGSVRTVTRPRVMLRAVLEAIVAFTYITALKHLPLANVVAIFLASSLIIIAMAGVTGLERIGWRRTTAILVGFCGVLLVVQPRAEGFNLFSLLALASAFLVAIRDLVTRRIADDVPSGVVAVATTLAVMLFGFLLGMTETWQPLQLRESLYLSGAAIMVALGNITVIMAFRDGDVSVVSGLRYSVLVFALVAGWLIWGDLPNGLALLGAGLIVGSGVYALHRQNLLKTRSAAVQVIPDGPPPA
jgi:drug/metabolite transporter (DMT)-like permease